MKIVVGLGNPGKKYENTRHNVGFMVVDQLVDYVQHGQSPLVLKNDEWHVSTTGQLEYRWLGVGESEIELVKPHTFMNKSGKAVAYVLRKHPHLSSDDIYLVHDDLDIPLGKFKIQKGTGPRVHRGVSSVEQVLGTKDFWRVRVGVENRREVLRQSGSPPNYAKATMGRHRARNAQDDTLALESLASVSNRWRTPGEKYVLMKFTPDEKMVVEAVIDQVIQELLRRVASEH